MTSVNVNYWKSIDELPGLCIKSHYNPQGTQVHYTRCTDIPHIDHTASSRCTDTLHGAHMYNRAM